MKTFTTHTIVNTLLCAVATLSLLLAFTACASHSWKQPAPATDSAYIEDSLLTAAQQTGSLEAELAVIDSLETAGITTSQRANLLRGESCSRHGQLRTAEFYWQKVMETQPTDSAALSCYGHAAASIANVSVNRGNYERALRAAMPALQLLTDDSDNTLTRGILLESVGRCQLGLAHTDEAAISYGQAYRCYLSIAALPGRQAEGLHHAIIGAHNTALSYFTTHLYHEALSWTERTDTLLRRYAATDGAAQGFIDHVQARIWLHRAIAYQGQGNTARGAKAYREYLATAYGQSGDGRIDATSYLMEAKRYAEAADNYRELDRILDGWGVRYTMHNAQRYLFPKYRANAYAGRRDSAVAIGLQLLTALDTAIARSLGNDAAELATIYDTQRMETEIALNQVALTQQRLITTVVAAVALTILFVLYLLYRRRNMQRLAAEHEKTEAALRMKTKFIEQISHEIRTPLNILSGFSQILTTPGMELDEETKRDAANQIQVNTQRITGLVNKMLELSDANSQSVIERSDECMVAEIAAQAAQESGILEASHLDFDLSFAEGLEALTLRTNQKAATRALALLLDNARKFTMPAEAYARPADSMKKERASLHVELTADGRNVRFVVQDTGKGIPADEAEHIFEEFVQLDDYYDGTGIGLNVARSMARRLGGDIVLDTTYTAGARFVMTLKRD